MPPRIMIAYALMACMVLAAVAMIAWARYHSHARKYARRVRREDQAHQNRLNAQSAGEGPQA